MIILRISTLPHFMLKLPVEVLCVKTSGFKILYLLLWHNSHLGLSYELGLQYISVVTLE